MIKFIKNNIKLFEIAFLLFLSLTPLLWLKEGNIILGHDSGFRLDPAFHLSNLFYSWDQSANFGADWSWFKGAIITQFPEAFFITLTNSYTLGQKLTFIFWFLSIGISMYIFINSFFKEKQYWFLRVFASTFYMYNFFLLQGWFIVERAKFSLFALLPLGLLYTYKTLTKEYSVLKGAIFFSLTSFFFNAGGNATFYGTFLLTYGISFVVLTAINIRRKGFGELFYSVRVGFLFVLGFLAVNSYWVLPQAYSFLSGYISNLNSVGGIESIISWESVITQYASFINLLRLQGMPDWYDNNLHTYSTYFIKNPFLIVLSFTPLVILLFGVFYHKKLRADKKNGELIILMLLFLLFGLFFTAGSHPPFGSIYIAFIKYVPGFAIFRSAFYKFGAVLWFSYIFLVSYYINLILLNFSKRKIIYVLISLLSFIFILTYHFPFFNGNFFVWNRPFTTQVKLPAYVTDMASYINKLPNDTRILLLPEFYSNADSYKWGFWGIDSLPRVITNKSIVANTSNDLEIVNSIYYAVSQKNENLFIHLVGISGINRVLWRDDVLYSDRIRTSKSLSSIKENLESFRGIKLEKKVGDWNLYSISSPDYEAKFHSADTIIYAKSNLAKLRHIFNGLANTGNPAILFDETIRDKNLGIVSWSTENVIGAECIACASDTYNPTYAGLPMPQLTILPNSPFYYILTLREDQIAKAYSKNPKFRIDAALGHSSKRIVEMREIANAKLKEADPRLFVRQSIKRYKSLIDDAITQSSMLNEKEKNTYLIKILTYINSHFYFLSTQRNLYDYALEDFEELSVFMQENIRSIRGKIWASDLAQNRIRYFISVEESDIYDIHIPTETLQPESILLDAKQLTQLKGMLLNKGTHELEVSYPITENLVDISDATESGQLRLAFGDRIKFEIKNFNQKERYFITFDYRILHGRPNAAVIEQGNNKYTWNLFLNQNTIWNSLNYVFLPSPETKSANLEFFPTGFETTGAVVEVKNLKVVKAYIPEVFISRHVPSTVKMGSPKISSSKLNATTYKVDIESSGPFFLVFGEAYSEGWRAYIVENNQTYNWLYTSFAKYISPANHYPLNGYSNGWLIDRKGNYSIIVEYFPQKIFYVGIVVTLISFGTIIILWIRRRKV